MNSFQDLTISGRVRARAGKSERRSSQRSAASCKLLHFSMVVDGCRRRLSFVSSEVYSNESTGSFDFRRDLFFLCSFCFLAMAAQRTYLEPACLAFNDVHSSISSKGQSIISAGVFENY